MADRVDLAQLQHVGSGRRSYRTMAWRVVPILRSLPPFTGHKESSMTQEEIYNELWAMFEPHTRKMTSEQMAEFDSLVDLCSRKVAASVDTAMRRQIHRAMKKAGIQGLMIAKIFALCE